MENAHLKLFLIGVRFAISSSKVFLLFRVLFTTIIDSSCLISRMLCFRLRVATVEPSIVILPITLPALSNLVIVLASIEMRVRATLVFGVRCREVKSLFDLVEGFVEAEDRLLAA